MIRAKWWRRPIERYDGDCLYISADSFAAAAFECGTKSWYMNGTNDDGIVDADDGDGAFFCGAKRKKTKQKKNHFSYFPSDWCVCAASVDQQMEKICGVTHICMQLCREQMVCVSLASCATPSIISLFEHIISRRIQHPVAAFARTVDAGDAVFAAVARRWGLVACHFDETIVQREIVSYRILPTLFVLAVVWESKCGERKEHNWNDDCDGANTAHTHTDPW